MTTAKIIVDGVELTIEQTIMKNAVYARACRVVVRDRERKLDITSGVEMRMEDALARVGLLKKVAAIQTSPCCCAYHHGYSAHCQSIYVARAERGFED